MLGRLSGNFSGGELLSLLASIPHDDQEDSDKTLSSKIPLTPLGHGTYLSATVWSGKFVNTDNVRLLAMQMEMFAASWETTNTPH